MAAKILGVRTVVPVHYEGWAHFRVPTSAARRSSATVCAIGWRWPATER